MLLPVLLAVQLLPHCGSCAQTLLSLKRNTLGWSFGKFASESESRLQSLRLVCGHLCAPRPRFLAPANSKITRALHGTSNSQKPHILHHGLTEVLRCSRSSVEIMQIHSTLYKSRTQILITTSCSQLRLALVHPHNPSWPRSTLIGAIYSFLR